MLSHPYVIRNSRGFLGYPAYATGNPSLLCSRENDGFYSDVPTRSRSDAVTDPEATVGGRHVIGRDGEAAFSTRSGLHCEEDCDQGGLVRAVQGVEREPDKDGAKQRRNDANVRASTPVAQVRTFVIRADTTIRYELLMRYLSTI